MLITDIFSKDLTLLYPVVKEFIKDLTIKDYKFIANSEYEKILKSDFQYACKIYWTEQFYRIQLGSILNLIRTIRWIDSIESSYVKNNHLGFCAAIRGLLESTADSCDAFYKIPHHLLEKFTLIEGVFKNTHHKFIKSQQLKDDLISFLFASNTVYNNNKQTIYKPKSIKTYISTLDGKLNGDLYDFYSKLCEVIHPSYFSCRSYTKNGKNDELEVIQINPNADENLNKSLIDSNKDNLVKLFQLSLIPSLTNLKVINLFDIKDFNLSFIDKIYFDQLEYWNQLLKIKK
jgi:DNA-binding protein Fis